MKEEQKSRSDRAQTRVLIIGYGKVGSALAGHLSRLGYKVLTVRRRSEDSRNLVSVVDVIVFSVPDREIQKQFMRLRRYIKPGTVVVHLSGAYGVELFKGAVERGVDTLALHPVKSFFSRQQAKRDLPGGCFALDGTKRGLRFGRRLVAQLKGKAVLVRSEDRPLYHAMCVFGSNFVHPLFYAVEKIGKDIGFAPQRAREIVMPLTVGVLRNIKKQGAVTTLTGPVKRGDWITVKRHLKALRERQPELVILYKQLTRFLERMK
ncbi:MAG: DUF2520 domain-containing protein [candidate division WOR-3 bacterium]|nr:DUF2520 domain-containing protein [candidate division WOR-3 bacterium]